MQYSHLSMQNGALYDALEHYQVKTTLEDIMAHSILMHPQASRHIQDAITYLTVGESKQSQIERILESSKCYARAA